MKAEQIVRRYIEAERDIVVIVSRVSPIVIKHKAIERMTYHLRDYVVAKPAPASTSGHELTMLQFCSRIAIDKEPGSHSIPNRQRCGQYPLLPGENRERSR